MAPRLVSLMPQMDDRGIDTNDKVEIADKRCGILEVMEIGRPIDQREAMRRMKRLHVREILIQPGEIDDYLAIYIASSIPRIA